MEHLTEEIPEFPFYTVSNDGIVWNTRYGQPQAHSYTQHGDPKVTLTNYDGRATLSVRVLVAEAFVPRPDDLSDTVILLNNDRTDLRAENLAWRPRWFAWNYAHQFKKDFPPHYHNIPVVNLETGQEYPSIIICGMLEGLLFDDIWRSTNTGDRIYPSGTNYAVSL